MSPFSVWAPRARQVELELNERLRPMTRVGPPDSGWWIWDEAAPEHGQRYRFALDGGDPLPDPRSQWQPDGIHGASAVVDHGRFEWEDRGWQPPPLGAGVVYELHVGAFTRGGTFDSAIERLDHLVGLGITHVELMPVNEFSGRRGWGYDGVDLSAPHHAYGGPAGLKRLVNACHRRGLAVLLDVVYNHLGPAGNYLDRFGPYFTDSYKTFWGPAVNFDGPESLMARRFFIDNALMWLRDYHIDGLRLDAVHAMFDRSAVHFLEELAVSVNRLEQALGRRLTLVAESDLNDPRLLWPRGHGGFGLDAQWCDDFHHALHVFLTKERDGYYEDFQEPRHLKKAMERAYVYDGQFSRHRRRAHGRPPDHLSGDRFVVCLQNHDQIGNRAQGERTSHLLDPDRLKVGAALLLTSPFVPLLFQGEEWGARSPFLYFTDHADPELARAVSKGRIQEFAAFGWKPEEVPDPQSLETFQRSQLDWDELAKPEHSELLDWHRALIRLRRSTPELSAGPFHETQVQVSEDSFHMRRGRNVYVVCNLKNARAALSVWPSDTEPRPEDSLLLASAPGVRLLPNGGIELPPNSVAIVRRQSSLIDETESHE